jgi:hypothetical protein
MKNLSLIVLLILIWTSGYASSESKSKFTDIKYTKTLFFEEYNDPGWLKTRNGNTYNFNYVGFTYENISTWKKGRELIYTYSDTKGTSLSDPISGAIAYVGFSKKHPIEIISDSCAVNSRSTMGITICYEEELNNWMVEMARILKVLKTTNSKKNYKVIEEMHKSWLTYKKNRYDVGRIVHADDEGTITVIESAARAVKPVMDHTLFLLSLIKY